MWPTRLLDRGPALLAASVLVIVPSLCPAGARAQSEPPQAQEEGSPQQVDLKDEEARQLFQAARLAFQDGRFEDALRSFRRAYDLSGRPGLLYNIGTTADRLRRDDEAIEAFEKYLELAPNAPNHGEVERRLEVLRSHAESATEPAQGAPEQGGATEGETEAPTPEQTASAAMGGEAARTGASGEAGAGEDEGGSGIASKWWFWTLVGVVVLGGAAAGVGVALAGGGDGNIPSTDWTVNALRGTR